MSMHTISAVVLAGGRGRRMQGEDKGLIDIAGQPLIRYVLDRIRPQVQHIVISANRNQSRYEKLGYPVISDTTTNFSGPLAGIACAMQQSNSDYLLVVPCDAPQLPDDLVQRLTMALRTTDGAKVAMCHDGKRLQPLFALLQTDLAPTLNEALNAGHCKAGRWLSEQPHAIAHYADNSSAFLNINTLQDKALFSASCHSGSA